MLICKLHIFLLHSSFNGSLGPFHSLAIVNRVAKSMDVKNPLQQGDILWVHALEW